MKNWTTHALILLFAILLAHGIAYKIVHIPRQLELVAIFSLLLFYPIMRWPLCGMYAVFIISPFIPLIRRLYYLVYARPAMDPLLMAGDLLLVFILCGLFFVFQKQREHNASYVGFVRMVFIYFVYLVLRTFFFNYSPLDVALSKFKFYGPPVLFFFVGTVFAEKFEDLKRFWHITILISIIAAAYGLKQLYFGYSAAEHAWFSSIEFSTLFIKDVARPFSFFQAPVAFADYAQLGLIGILMSLSWMKRPFHLVLVAAIPLLFYAALITSVRSSWIGFIVSFIIWFIFFRVKGNAKRIMLLILVIVGFLGYQYLAESFQTGITFGSGHERVAPTTVNQDYFNLLVANRATALTNPFQEHSLLSRVILWQNLIAYSRDPILAILGRGLGTLNADSIYFTYLAEFGYPGMFFIIVVFYLFSIQGFRCFDSSKDPAVIALAKGIVVMDIVFAVVSITGTHIHYFPGDIYFWFWNGVLIRLAAIPSSNGDNLQEGDMAM